VALASQFEKGRIFAALHERDRAFIIPNPWDVGTARLLAQFGSVDRPVNVVMGLQGVQLSMAELSAIGVKRISVGSALARAALGAFLRAAREMQEYGTFTFAEQAVDYRDINTMFGQ